MGNINQEFYTSMLTDGQNNEVIRTKVFESLNEKKEIDKLVINGGFAKSFIDVLDKLDELDADNLRKRLQQMDQEISELNSGNESSIVQSVSKQIAYLGKKATDLGEISNDVFNTEIAKELIVKFKGKELSLVDFSKTLFLIEKKLDFMELLKYQTEDIRTEIANDMNGAEVQSELEILVAEDNFDTTEHETEDVKMNRLQKVVDDRLKAIKEKGSSQEINLENKGDNQTKDECQEVDTVLQSQASKELVKTQEVKEDIKVEVEKSRVTGLYSCTINKTPFEYKGISEFMEISDPDNSKNRYIKVKKEIIKNGREESDEYTYIMINENGNILEVKNDKNETMNEFSYIEKGNTGMKKCDYYFLHLKEKYQTNKSLNRPQILIDEYWHVDQSPSGQREFFRTIDNVEGLGDSAVDYIKVKWDSAEILSNVRRSVIINNKPFKYKKVTKFLDRMGPDEYGNRCLNVKTERIDKTNGKAANIFTSKHDIKDEDICIFIDKNGNVKSFKNNKGQDISEFSEISLTKDGNYYFLQLKKRDGMSDRTHDHHATIALDREGKQIVSADGNKYEFFVTLDLMENDKISEKAFAQLEELYEIEEEKKKKR